MDNSSTFSLLSSVYSDVGLMKALDVPSLYTQIKSLRSMLKEVTSCETVVDSKNHPFTPIAKELSELIRVREQQLVNIILLLHKTCVTKGEDSTM